MPAVVLDRVTRVYRGPRSDAVHAVGDLSLEVQDRECLVLLGPSGSGKTTTLRLIAGVDVPTSGDVHLDGRSQRGIPPEDRGAAMVFQDHPLLPHLTVSRQLELVLQFSKVPAEQRAPRRQEAVRWLDLEPLLARHPGELSGGERQRVALALAVLRQPRLLLLDEPFAQVDAPQRSRLRADLLRLRRQLGWTMILVTHDQQEAALLADRVALLHQGRLRQCAPFPRLLSQPADLFVAGFVGSPPMNFFRGRLGSDAPGTLRFLASRGWSWPLPANCVPPGAIGPSLVLGLRPRHLRVLLPGAAGLPLDSLPMATLESVQEAAGEEAGMAMLTLDDETVLARIGDKDALAPEMAGSRVALAPDWAAAHWFEAGSGRRLGP